MVTAPFDVSGTAALTGIYRAYESITGTTLSDLAKTIGAEELVLTGELAEYIGSEEATELINELKKILDQTQNMSDDDVRTEIRKIAEQYNVVISDSQVEQLLTLCRRLEKLDVNALQSKLVTLAETVQKANAAKETVSAHRGEDQQFLLIRRQFLLQPVRQKITPLAITPMGGQKGAFSRGSLSAAPIRAGISVGCGRPVCL